MVELAMVDEGASDYEFGVAWRRPGEGLKSILLVPFRS